MALGQQGFRKVVGPAYFSGFHLRERGLQIVRPVLSCAALDGVGNVHETFVDLFFITGVAAQKIIIEVQAVQHDLVTHGFNRANAVECRRGVQPRRALPQSSEDIDDQQQHQDGQNRAEPHV